ncbi:hypothetical protein B23_0900 [Geobacillus thermoleovorans B23]|nr:hypothetical protein B23_0900 [Geobacillus thermoleovorans B23]
MMPNTNIELIHIALFPYVKDDILSLAPSHH